MDLVYIFAPQVKADWSEPELILAVTEYTPKVFYYLSFTLVYLLFWFPTFTTMPLGNPE